MVDVITIGDSSIDLYMKVSEKDTFPENENGSQKICFFHGSKIPVEKFQTCVGGNAINVAIGVKNLGLTSAVYTELGKDENGTTIVKELEKIGVDHQYCYLNENSPTNVHAVIVYSGDRTIFSYHEKRNYKLPSLPKPKWIYYSSLADGFEGVQAKLVEYINNNPGVALAFNPGTIHMKKGLESLRDILGVTDVLFVNKEEAIQFVETAEIENLHLKLQTLGPKLTVITDGANGASAHDSVSFVKMDILKDPRPVVDKTGAGDAFSSGFMAALAYGKNLKEALAWGIANSGNMVREIGAVNGLLTKKEMEEKVKTL